MLVLACALEAAPLQAVLTQHCNWGVPAPTVWPASTQVMMMPIVMAFGPPTTVGRSKVAFISFATASDINRDGGGVLRIIDGDCNEIARFPDPSFPVQIPNFCPPDLLTVPHLAPTSGLAAGNIDGTPDVEIIGVLDGPTSNHSQLIAFNLAGGVLVPKWCSAPLPPGDFIAGPSAPAIAQLDRPPHPATGQSEIILDNKVFDFDGNLRYTGVSSRRSRTAVVARLGNTSRVITGRGVYGSIPAFWTGTPGWVNPIVTNSSLVYPAVAEIDSSSPGPEIVVTDTMARRLRVLRWSGPQLASILLPGVPGCGGPPMIGNAVGNPRPEIGVASCTRYTLFKYTSGTLFQPMLIPLWWRPITDPSGQTTSTLYNTPTGARIYYNDASHLWVFDGATGSLLQSVPNTSNTSFEGPVIAAFDFGSSDEGRVIVAANDYHLSAGGQRGIRIFADSEIGLARSYWNQHTYHATNVMNSVGAIPATEPPSWLTPARNTYRVQQWP